MVADIGDPTGCEAICKKALADHGPIDILINNVGGRHYESAKAALVNFIRATAVDWALHDITVNAICPGGLMTEPNQR